MRSDFTGQAGARPGDSDSLSDYSPQVGSVRKAVLMAAKLRGAKLNGAMPREANLIDANLSGANLSGANLIWADLRGARLRPFTGRSSLPRYGRLSPV
jgi:uncharacterized protein YjbI with pentapeptide repeats